MGNSINNNGTTIWGGLKVHRDQIANKGTVKNGDKVTYYIDFKTGTRIYYDKSPSGFAESHENGNNMVSSLFENINGLVINGHPGKQDNIEVSKCDIKQIDLYQGNGDMKYGYGDTISIHDSKNGKLFVDSKDDVYLTNNENLDVSKFARFDF